MPPRGGERVYIIARPREPRIPRGERPPEREGGEQRGRRPRAESRGTGRRRPEAAAGYDVRHPCGVVRCGVCPPRSGRTSVHDERAPIPADRGPSRLVCDGGVGFTPSVGASRHPSECGRSLRGRHLRRARTMVVHWITSLLGHTRQRRVPTRPAFSVAQTRRLPPRRSAERLPIVGHAAPIVKSPVSSRRAAGSGPAPTRTSTAAGRRPFGSLGGRAQTTAQRPGIMMCADDVPVSMTHEPARV